MTFATDFRETFEAISIEVPGVDEPLKQAMLALACRQHVLWLGKPGRAKSMLIRLMFSRFEGAKTFKKQMARDTKWSDLFGAMIADRLLESGEQIYNLTGGLADSDFVFLDEWEDAPIMMRRELLTAFYERVLETKDMSIERLPMHTTFMASNFHQDDEVSRALNDRIMCKAVIPRIHGLSERVNMYQYRLNGGSLVLPTLSFEDLKEFSATVTDGSIGYLQGPMVMHAMLMSSYNIRRHQIAQEEAGDATATDRVTQVGADHAWFDDGIEATTPRTETELLNLARASAALNGRRTVTYGDLRALGYGLVTLNGQSDNDAQAWAEICDWLLPTKSKEVKAFNGLAGVAVDVANVRKYANTTNPIALKLGGELYEGRLTDALVMIDRMVAEGGNGTHCVQQLGRWIKDDLEELHAPRSTVAMPWGGDWK